MIRASRRIILIEHLSFEAMHPFHHYNLEDFLTDDDFRLWVKSGRPRTDFFWAKLKSGFPEKRAD